MARRPKRSHNGGPPLDEYKGPPWGKGDPYIFLAWQAAHAKAWKAPSREVMLMRMDKAERLGLTYEEYTLEILERGRHLREEDTERISAIKAARKRRRCAISTDAALNPFIVSKGLAMNSIEIGALSPSPETLTHLADLLVETVAAGGSVSFMHPLAPGAASAFWEKSLAAAARGERMVLGAWDGTVLVGTVTLLLDCPPNQPHRAEIAKLMTSVEYRGRGVGTRLMRAAERLAVDKGRTLLVLDTATDEGASGLYERLGFTLAGEIPDYALKPHGGLTGTLIYWKRIGASSR